MRVAAVAGVIALIAVGLFIGVSGCTPFANDDLKRLVETALLPGMDKRSCEWGSSSYENDPKSWYGCWDYVSGDPGLIGGAIQGQLGSAGFAVASVLYGPNVELTATRTSERVCIDVLPYGFGHGRNTSPAEVELSPGQVFVDVWAVEPRHTNDAPCAELPPGPE